MTKYETVLANVSSMIARMKPGDRLPTEQQLSREYAVSAMTVRRALQTLIDAKRIIGIRGSGTFVAEPMAAKRMVLTSFTDSMREAGMTAHADVLTASIERADQDASEQLGVDVGEQAYRIFRPRYGDNTPLCLDRSVLRASSFPGLLGHDLSSSLYSILQKSYRIVLSRAQSRITAVLPSADDAELLTVTPEMPCIRVRSRSLTDDGAVVESTESLYRGDRYELIVEPDSSPKGSTPTLGR